MKRADVEQMINRAEAEVGRQQRIESGNAPLALRIEGYHHNDQTDDGPDRTINIANIGFHNKTSFVGNILLNSENAAQFLRNRAHRNDALQLSKQH